MPCSHVSGQSGRYCRAKSSNTNGSADNAPHAKNADAATSNNTRADVAPPNPKNGSTSAANDSRFWLADNPSNSAATALLGTGRVDADITPSACRTATVESRNACQPGPYQGILGGCAA